MCDALKVGDIVTMSLPYGDVVDLTIPGRSVVFASAATSRSTVAHRDDEPRRRALPDNAWYYLCGPIPFMQAVRSGVHRTGVAPSDIQYEVFGPHLWQAHLD